MRFSFQRALAAACVFLAGAFVASADIFEPLFTATRIIGNVQVVRPGRAPEPMRVDHSYPYGTRIIVPDEMMVTNGVPGAASEARLELARDFRFRLGPGTDVTLEDLSVGEGDDLSEVKRFDLRSGSVFTYITANTQKTGGGIGDAQVDKNLAAIVIRTPVGECTRLAQRNEVKVEPDPVGDGCTATFTTQSGMMEVFGPQYAVKDMKRNASVAISGNEIHTAITTVNGEYVVAFEKGADQEERALFKARCLGKIWRQKAEVGGRMAVAVMIYYPRGNSYEMKSYNYLEGQTNVGMWTSVAAAVLGEHNMLAATDGATAAAGESDGESGGDSEWNPDADDGEDDGGWNPDDAEDDGGDFGGDDGGDSFDFGW